MVSGSEVVDGLPGSVLHSDPDDDDTAVTAELAAVLVRRLSEPSLLRDQGRAPGR